MRHHIECRVEDTDIWRSPASLNGAHFVGITLLNMYVFSRWGVRVKGRPRGCDVKGDSMGVGQNRQGVTPYFVGSIMVACDPVRPDDNGIDSAQLHEPSGH